MSNVTLKQFKIMKQNGGMNTKQEICLQPKTYQSLWCILSFMHMQVIDVISLVELLLHQVNWNSVVCTV